MHPSNLVRGMLGVSESVANIYEVYMECVFTLGIIGLYTPGRSSFKSFLWRELTFFTIFTVVK